MPVAPGTTFSGIACKLPNLDAHCCKRCQGLKACLVPASSTVLPTTIAVVAPVAMMLQH